MGYLISSVISLSSYVNVGRPVLVQHEPASLTVCLTLEEFALYLFIMITSIPYYLVYKTKIWFALAKKQYSFFLTNNRQRLKDRLTDWLSVVRNRLPHA